MFLVSKVWIPHETLVYELAKIVSEDSATFTVEVLRNGEVQSVKKSDVHIADPTHFIDCDDLSSMNNLHEAPLIHVLKRRLESAKIYTNAGNILISVNPYEKIKGLYDSPSMYLDLPDEDDHLSSRNESESNPPHIYVVANRALRHMLMASDSFASAKTLLNQSVIVSGESGAGKTEASKHVLNFLIAANNQAIQHAEKLVPGLKEANYKIRQVLIDGNVIFEAFGNSKTVRNDNSSRFGKYIKLEYTDDNQLMSAFTETFLLEKSRLVSIGKSERNYHIFYQLVRGLNDSFNLEVRDRLRLTSVDAFSILTEGDCTVITSEGADVADFRYLSNSLSSLDATTDEIDSLWEILAVILHLGNIVCIEPSSEGQPATISSPSCPLEELADLLGVSAEAFTQAITRQRMTAAKRGSVHYKILSPKDTRNNILGLIKWLYEVLFSWLVRKINYAHGAVSGTYKRETVKFIGILDIFGFEILQVNSFEQLCINFTNERLQQQFNEYVFVTEQLEYEAEQLRWSTVSYQDNQHVLDMIAKKPTGIMNILEEHSMLNRAPDDIKLLQALHQAHEKHPAYMKPRISHDTFIVKHFAGDVPYAIDGFLAKNNNSLQDDLMELLVGTEHVFLANAMVGVVTGALSSVVEAKFFPGAAGYVPPRSFEEPLPPPPMPPPPGPGGGGAALPPPTKRPTMGTANAKKMPLSLQFRNQLETLIRTLRDTQPHYIKCIKPNSEKRPGIFNARLIAEQLRYSGTLEMVRIRREGYPTRMAMVDFYRMFRCLTLTRGWEPPLKATTEQIRKYVFCMAEEKLPPKSFQLGATKIFMKDGVLLGMQESASTALTPFVILVQSFVRRCMQKMKFVVLLAAKRERDRIEAEERVRAEEARRREEEARRLAEEERLRKEAEERERERLRREEEERVAKLRREQEEEAARVREVEERARMEELMSERRQQELRLEAMNKAVSKLQKFVRVCMRKKRWVRRVPLLHQACARGDLEAIKKALEENPHDRGAQDPTSGTASLVRSAAKGCQLHVLQHLAPTKDELLALDSKGNNIIHDAMLAPSAEVADYFGATLDSVVAPSDAVETDTAVIKEEGLKYLKSANGGGVVLMQGWLSKRKDGREWKRRWCILTETDLSYYTKQGDTVPKGVVSLNLSTIRASKGRELTLEIVLAPGMAKAKRTFFFKTSTMTSMQFLAENEAALYNWMFALRSVTGSVEPIRWSPEEKVSYFNTALRSKAVAATNETKDTPLHALVNAAVDKAKGSGSDGSGGGGVGDVSGGGGDNDIVQLLSVAYWLRRSGCPMDARNSDGLTAVDLATRGGLAHVGEKLRLLMPDGFPPNNTGYMRCPKPPQIPGFSYLSLVFSAQKLKEGNGGTTFQNKRNLHLKISVMNDARQPVEVEQSTYMPIHADSYALFWGQTWFMQTPLENLHFNTQIIIQLIHDASKAIDFGGGSKDTAGLEHKATTQGATVKEAGTQDPSPQASPASALPPPNTVPSEEREGGGLPLPTVPPPNATAVAESAPLPPPPSPPAEADGPPLPPPPIPSLEPLPPPPIPPPDSEEGPLPPPPCPPPLSNEQEEEDDEFAFSPKTFVPFALPPPTDPAPPLPPPPALPQDVQPSSLTSPAPTPATAPDALSGSINTTTTDSFEPSSPTTAALPPPQGDSTQTQHSSSTMSATDDASATQPSTKEAKRSELPVSMNFMAAIPEFVVLGEGEMRVMAETPAGRTVVLKGGLVKVPVQLRSLDGCSSVLEVEVVVYTAGQRKSLL